MGKHDGVFRKESFDEHYTTLLKEMGMKEGLMVGPMDAIRRCMVRRDGWNGVLLIIHHFRHP
jgi:hypothetical protein